MKKIYFNSLGQYICKQYLCGHSPTCATHIVRENHCSRIYPMDIRESDIIHPNPRNVYY